MKCVEIVYLAVYCVRQLPTSATYSPGRLAVKTSEKHLAPFVVLLAVTWVFLRLGMEIFAR